MEHEGGDNDKGKKEEGKKPEEISVKVGEETKTFSSEQVIEMAQKVEAAGLVEGVAAEISKAADKYETDPSTYIIQAEGAFAAVTKLIDLGVIDEAGNVLEKKDKVVKPQLTPPKDTPALIPKPDTGAENKIADEVTKALEPMIKEVTQVKDDVGRMYRMDLERKLQDKHPNLDSDDVSQIFGKAMNDQKKSLWDHAEDFVKGKEGRTSELRKANAKEFGINLAEFDARNKLKEQSAAGGAVVFTEGKSLSFGKRDRGKDSSKSSVSPREAMVSFFKNQESGGS